MVSRVAIPRIGGIISDRRARIENDLNDAAKAQKAAEDAAKAFEANLAQAKAKAQGIAQAAREAASKEADAKRHQVEAEQAAKLVADIERVPVGGLSFERTAGWNSDYAQLAAKAPPPLKVLSLICEREQAIAEGQPDHVKQPVFWQRWLSQVKG